MTPTFGIPGGWGTLYISFNAFVFLVVVLYAMAWPSIKYKRLALLVATLRLPKHRLEDFSILQTQNGAMQIFDQPINVDLIVSLCKIFFWQALVFAIAIAGGSTQFG